MDTKRIPIELINDDKRLQGSEHDALTNAIGANCRHGLRRSRKDKKKSVITALRDPILGKLSSRKLADICGVSHDFVARQRLDFDSHFELEVCKSYIAFESGKALIVERIDEHYSKTALIFIRRGTLIFDRRGVRHDFLIDLLKQGTQYFLFETNLPNFIQIETNGNFLINNSENMFMEMMEVLSLDDRLIPNFDCLQSCETVAASEAYILCENILDQRILAAECSIDEFMEVQLANHFLALRAEGETDLMIFEELSYWLRRLNVRVEDIGRIIGTNLEASQSN